MTPFAGSIQKRLWFPSPPWSCTLMCWVNNFVKNYLSTSMASWLSFSTWPLIASLTCDPFSSTMFPAPVLIGYNILQWAALIRKIVLIDVYGWLSLSSVLVGYNLSRSSALIGSAPFYNVGSPFPIPWLTWEQRSPFWCTGHGLASSFSPDVPRLWDLSPAPLQMYARLCAPTFVYLGSSTISELRLLPLKLEPKTSTANLQRVVPSKTGPRNPILISKNTHY